MKKKTKDHIIKRSLKNIMQSEAIRAANQRRYREGIKAFEQLKARCKDPMTVNRELLLRILRENENTEYGRKYDFRNIRTIRDFQEKVPVTLYADYSGYTDRMSRNGESNLICAAPVDHYNGSSGTTGVVKTIPMPKPMRDIYMTYVTLNVCGVLADTIGDSWIDGRFIRLVECPSDEHFLPCGATFGSVTSTMTKHYRPDAELLFTSPDEAIFPRSGTDTRYLHARFALMDPDATGCQVIYLSLLLVLFKYIENNWEMLVNDIETGTIDASIELPFEVLNGLRGKIRPMPERAAELRKIFSEGFGEPFVPKVWKNMKFINGVGTGGFKAYADTLRSRYTGEGIPFLKLGFVASEGAFTAPYRLNSDDTVLIPDSVFYEFLPLDAGDDFSKIVTIDGLEEGKDYEPIITNMGGFYRYRMRDAVRVVSGFENTPTVEYLYRIDQTLNMLGERTTEEALRTAANNTAAALGFELVDFSVYADLKAMPPRYQYFLETGRNADEGSADTIRTKLEEELGKASPAMKNLIDRGVCQHVKVSFLQPETYALWRDLAIFNGASPNQLKPLHIIRTENQRKFFSGMTEYSSEI